MNGMRYGINSIIGATKEFKEIMGSEKLCV